MLGFTITGAAVSPHPFPVRSNQATSPMFRFRVPRKLAVKAEKEKEKEKEGEEKGSENGGREEAKKGKDNKGPVLSVKWRDLLDPDPENILAIALSGVLTWASVQVLWQLFFISFAILVAALKYSFIAALLIFILITLL